ncbi:MAG: chromosome segregation protein SMC [Lachnospiraceae bacterium]|jgi:chromosome segregation protein|nr:chromosome segregation protein SMC [Lachnospiraceae bacterium]
MYLKSIEIQGFKSFANKIVFEFHNGITGIVGPNGSGKSNVSDAVRWVLGEQKVKQLRGASMQDVIFSGTELRKPQGFAFVSITLDNSDGELAIDYAQVTVSRRLYRSGESEYKINGSICRLRDVYELFYDTGIGKEGYSIIGQGQIDRILSGKPEERRELFDEAAGIVKFKKRKAVAIKELEDEKQKQILIEVRLADLEKRVGPLERQAKAARAYLSLREQLKEKDICSFLLETAGIRESLADTGSKQAIVAADIEETRKASLSQKEEYEKLEEALAALDEGIAAKREASGAAQVRKSDAEGQAKVLAEQINTENMSYGHVLNRLNAIEAEKAAKARESEDFSIQSQELSAALSDGEGRRASAQDELAQQDGAIAAMEGAAEEQKSALMRSMDDKTAALTQKQKYETMLEQLNIRKAELAQRMLSITAEELGRKDAEDAAIAKVDGLGAGKGDAKRREGEASGAVAQGEEALRTLGRRLGEKQQEYHTCYTKLEALRNLAERYDGYGNSIRRVMETKDRVFGIRGVVADLITTRKEYETAIETALGGSIQNIVTDTENVAKQLIEYLKKNKYGRATFLPLDSVSFRPLPNRDALLKEPGAINMANELVGADKEYAGLMGYLLGRVLVADNVDHAVAIAKKYQYSLRIVTLEGELLSPGGSITGGAFKNTSNLLGRKREIEELEAHCDKAEKAAAALESESQAAQEELAGRREALARVKEEIVKLDLELNTATIHANQLAQERARLAQSKRELEAEGAQLESQSASIVSGMEAIARSITSLDTDRDSTQARSEELAAALERARADREALAGRLGDINLEIAELAQKHRFVSENRQRIEGEVARLSQEAEELSQNRERSTDAVARKQEQIESIKVEIQGLEGQIAALEEEALGLSKEKEALSARHREFFAKREETADRLAALEKDSYRLQNQMEKLEERLETQSGYMWDEYELTFHEAKRLSQERGIDVTALRAQEVRKEISGLKEQIRQMGPVNVNAIEEFREVSDEYTFMKDQFEDLTKSQEHIEGIIAELDEGMRRQFQEKFKEIDIEFNKVFRELFGGGHGTLELMEDEDILEAGVQIIAQPPGKKLQNMMQLSGGEKALTAICLLFAIQNLKPSPFCLLDEIEAALDDSNVDRFARYLHRLSKRTQFIIITHRRGTMVAADRLYGITMQEKGVSTLVSVNLIEHELDA